jgi:hypothetical protein
MSIRNAYLVQQKYMGCHRQQMIKAKYSKVKKFNAHRNTVYVPQCRTVIDGNIQIVIGILGLLAWSSQLIQNCAGYDLAVLKYTAQDTDRTILY